jgi:hypothetical protein
MKGPAYIADSYELDDSDEPECEPVKARENSAEYGHETEDKKNGSCR